MNELLLVVALLAGPGAKVDGLDAATVKALRAGPWTVTSVAAPMAGADRHAYYSEAPYWWPDPANPGGPFVRRDGEFFPERFDKHRKMIGEMSQTLLALGLRASLLGDKAAVRRGAEVARVWFLNGDTRMAPHLEYGQAIRGRNTGRGAGIIDTRSLIWAVEGLRRLEGAGAFSAEERAGLREWFRAYTKWMRESKIGAKEGLAKNNHGTWWAAQVLAFSTYTGEGREWVYEQARGRMIPGQIRADGSCPEEEARTRSLSYSAMNLDGWAVVAHYAGRDGVELWGYRAKGAGSIRDAVGYLRPFVAAPGTWKKQQISKFDGGRIFVRLEGAARGEVDLGLRL